MSKWVELDFARCRPRECDPDAGACVAAEACTRHVLLQETPGEPPLLLSREVCRGCRDCVRACPLEAIR